MYEIGDDLMLLGSDKDRLALVENRALLNIPKVGRAFTPVDLMTYEAEDEQPSIFFLRQSPRHAMLTIFNWTNTARSHTIKLADLGLRTDGTYTATDVLNQNESVALAAGALRIENQPSQSVRVIKIIDANVAPAAPAVTAKVPATATAGETIHVSAQVDAAGEPAVSYHWDFGDGISADGPEVAHCYTRAADFTVRLTVEGVDGTAAQQTFPMKVSGRLRVRPKLTENQRFVEPTDR
jgi:hypothetical protein